MRIGAPKEIARGEARVALTPESAERLQKLGYDCLVESGAGAAASITDAAYEAVGVASGAIARRRDVRRHRRDAIAASEGKSPRRRAPHPRSFPSRYSFLWR